MTWNTIPLKRVSTFSAGGTPSVDQSDYWAYDDDGYPWVAISDMSSVDAVTRTARQVSTAGLRAARIKPGKPGTILFSMYASLGHTAFLTAPAAWNQAILGLWPNSKTDARFLRYCLVAIRPQLLEQARSNTQANLNAEVVGNLRVPYPPLDEQRRIADFLDAETSRIDQFAALRQKVRTSIGSRIVAQLDFKIDELTETYGTLPFRRMIWTVEQGVSPQCDNSPADLADWGVLKVSAVKSGKFFEDENKQLPSGLQPEPRYEIKDGDLLITRANTPLLVGAAAVADSPRPKLMLCDKIFRILTNKDLLPNFLVLISLGTRIRDMCGEASHGASQSMANLKVDEIKRWPIPAAPVSVQQAAVKELSAARDQVFTLTSAIAEQLALLTERRQALITAAVTGQIDVSTARGVAV